MSGAILLGLALGMRHAMDPDHVATLVNLAARERRARDAGFLGASWALGHGITIALVGLLLIALQVSLPDALARYSEATAGLLLLLLGLVNLSRCRARSGGRTAGLHGALARSAGIGLVHGLAGSGAITLVAVTTFPNALASGAYLAAFSCGVAASMVACSLLLGTPIARLQRATRAAAVWSAVTGMVAVLMGASLVWGALLSDVSRMS